MLDGLLLGWMLIAWGAQAAVPWRLAHREPATRRLLSYALLPLLVTGALAAIGYGQSHPDAAIVQSLYPLGASRTGRLLAVLLPAMILADLVAAFGWRRLEPAGWRIAGVFGLVFLVAASWAVELMRVGEGPASAPIPLLLLTGLRLLIALSAAEALAPGRPVLAPIAGLALPLYVLLLPADLARQVWGGQGLTVAAAATLFLVARWLPASLRRPALAGAALLAGLLLAAAADLSQGMAGPALEISPG